MFDKSYNILINISDDTPVFHTPRQLVITPILNYLIQIVNQNQKYIYVQMMGWDTVVT